MTLAKPPASGVQDNSPLPSIVFQHIPTTDYQFSASDGCKGYNGDGQTDAIDYDAGIVQTLSNMGNVAVLAVGHNHGNDYCCPYSASLSICFGRHSGYGGYGSWERGARVYEISIQEVATKTDSLYSIEWESWVRLETGGIIHRFPTQLDSDADATNDSYIEYL